MNEDLDVGAVDDLDPRDATLHLKDDILALVDDDGLELSGHFEVRVLAVLEEDAVLHLDLICSQLHSFVLEVHDAAHLASNLLLGQLLGRSRSSRYLF